MQSERIFALSVWLLPKFFVKTLLLQWSATKLNLAFMAFLFSAHSITISLINVFHEDIKVCVPSPLPSLLGKWDLWK